jgi:hypothetical protein
MAQISGIVIAERAVAGTTRREARAKLHRTTSGSTGPLMSASSASRASAPAQTEVISCALIRPR